MTNIRYGSPALIDNGGLAEGGVDAGEERAAVDWGVPTKEHLTLGGGGTFDQLRVNTGNAAVPSNIFAHF